MNSVLCFSVEHFTELVKIMIDTMVPMAERESVGGRELKVLSLREHLFSLIV